MDDYGFNGSSDPVYQEVMETVKRELEAHLAALMETLSLLDGADETSQEYEALRRSCERLSKTGQAYFDLP